MLINKLKKKINIIKDFELIDTNNISFNDFKYDKNKAPYNHHYFISVTDENEYRLIIKTLKKDHLLGIGIDLIDLNRINNIKYPSSFFESEKKEKTKKNYAKIIALKEASFKAMSNLYRKKRIKGSIFDFEITKDIMIHNKSKKIIASYDAIMEYQIIIIDNYLFAIVVLRN